MLLSLIQIIVPIIIMITAIIIDGIDFPDLNVPTAKGDSEITAGFIGATAGIMGAFIGAYAGYRFNTKIEAQRTKERRFIQSKNTIFSPIYKQLLGLKSYLDARAAEGERPLRPLINVGFNGKYSGYHNYTFDIWENIKRDIRKLYVPEDRRNELDHLMQTLNSHMNLQDQIGTGNAEIAFQFAEKHKVQLITPKQWNHHILSSSLQDYAVGNVDLERATDTITAQLQHAFSFSDKRSRQQAVKLLEEVAASDHYTNLTSSFYDLLEETEQVTQSFERLMEDIIKKYEGGVDVT